MMRHALLAVFFQTKVLEDGKPQTITNFDEERGVAASPAASIDAAITTHRSRRFADQTSHVMGFARTTITTP